MKIHIGQIIKAELSEQNISISELAKEISIAGNAMYEILEQETICCDLLTKIGKILKCNFFSLYSPQNPVVPGNPATSCTGIQQTNNYRSEEVFAIIKHNGILEQEIVYLKKIISLMEGKKNEQEAKATSPALNRLQKRKLADTLL